MNMRPLAPVFVCAAVALTACGGKKPGTPYIDTSADFAGPAVAVTDDDTFTVTTPSGGWTIVLDQTIRDRYGIRAFATLTRPAPDAMNSQALVEHGVDVPGASGHPTALYIRLLDFKQRKPNEVPYRLAATTTPRP